METMSSMKRGWRRWTAMAAVFALLFHAALLLVHQPASAAADDPRDGTVVICTAFGLKVVSLADISNDAEPQNAPDKNVTPYCPVCLGAQLAGTFVQPLAVDLPMPSETVVVVSFVPRHESFVARIFVSALGPRAPPTIV